MKKFLIITMLLLTGCGYQPVYLDRDYKNFEFSKITSEGDLNINKKIINSLQLKEGNLEKSLNELNINSIFENLETSKNLKGNSKSYKISISVNLKITNNDNLIQEEKFYKEFFYNEKENQFQLVQQQQNIRENLINKIIEEITIYLNTK
jgi:outer membrane lipopolysaccharide assembly protein LptE/RlpB